MKKAYYKIICYMFISTVLLIPSNTTVLADIIQNNELDNNEVIVNNDDLVDESYAYGDSYIDTDTDNDNDTNTFLGEEISVLADTNIDATFDTTWQKEYMYSTDESKHIIYLSKYRGSDKTVVIPSEAIINGDSYKTAISGSFDGGSTCEFLDLRNLGKKINDLSYMFKDNKTLKGIDLRGSIYGDLGKPGVSMRGMCSGCYNLKKIYMNREDTYYVWDMSNMFEGCTSLSNLNMNDWDTSNVTVMNNMFRGCSSLSILDLDEWNVSNVRNFDGMFSGCSSLNRLDLSGWNFRGMSAFDGDMYEDVFKDCNSLETIDIPTELIVKVILPHEFMRKDDQSKKYTYLPMDQKTSFTLVATEPLEPVLVSEIDIESTSKAIVIGNTIQLFTNILPSNATNKTLKWITSDEKVATVDSEGMVTAVAAGKAIITAESTDGGNKSASCDIYVSDSSKWYDDYSYILDGTRIVLNAYVGNDTEIIIPAVAVIDGKTYITTLNENCAGFFKSAPQLIKIDLSNVDASRVTSMSRMFYALDKLKEVKFGRIDTRRVTSMEEMFRGCTSLNKVDINSLDTGNVERMDYMFYGCSKLVEVDLSNMNTHKLTDMQGMFMRCYQLISVFVDGLDTSMVTDMSYMFDNCTDFEQINISCLNTGSVKTFEGLFNGCTSLERADLRGLDTSSCINMSSMFKGCYNITQIDMSGLDTRNVKDINNMFDTCVELTEINMTGLDLRNLDANVQLFSNQRSLKTIKAPNYLNQDISLPGIFYNKDKPEDVYNVLPKNIDKSIWLKREIQVDSVAVDPSVYTAKVGDIFSLSPRITPQSADDKNLVWTSDNPDIASVDSAGTVTAKSLGEVKITATSANGNSGYCNVTVVSNDEIVYSRWITLTPSRSYIDLGESIVINAKYLPENAANIDLTWLSSDPDIATVDDNGKVTGKSFGTVVISLVRNNSTFALAYCKVSVCSKEVREVKISSDSINVEEGNSEVLSITVFPKYAAIPTVKWMSSNESVATVDSDGIVTAIAEGTATITATSTDGSNKCASCIVTVVKQIVETESISISPESQKIMIGDSYTLSATILPVNATDRSISWTSGNEKVATVSEAGVVTGIGAGTTDITATTSNGKTAKCAVTVNEKTVVVSFDVGTTEINAPNAITVAVNKAYGDLPVLASRTGWKHLGWYTEKTGGTLVEKTTIVTNTKDHILYAHWKEWDEEDQKNEEMNSGKDGSSITTKKIDLSGEFGTVTGSAVKFVIKDKAQKKLASVTGKGVLSAKKNGKVVVTVRKKDGSTWTEQDVTYNIVIPKGSSLPYGILYYTGQTFDLNTLLKDNGLLHPNSWTTTAKSTVATVDSKTGILTVGEKDGSATVYAVYGTDKNARKVKVSVKVSHKKIDISKDFTQITGKTRFKIVDKDSKKIASVTTKGILTAKKDGTVTVTLQIKNGKKWEDVETKTYQVSNPLTVK
ncbi:MAG: Ig-like domain-containing protein [Lachnospiraceae bacterium]|nr:Ig-like domain-containing protein [Lachnospiraceae bacterium]